MENRTQIQTGEILPLVVNNASGICEYPQPHHAYTHAVHHYMMGRTLGMDCLLYVDYIASQQMFRVNMGESRNISGPFRNEVDLEMYVIMARLLKQ